MKLALILSVLAALVAIGSSTALKFPKLEDETAFDKYFNNVEIFQRFYTSILSSYFLGVLGDLVEDPVEFQNFVYYHDGYYKGGLSQVFLPKMFGLKNMTRSMTVNRETLGIQMDITIPQLVFQGTYDMLILDLPFCTIFGCSEPHNWTGNGDYSHTFDNITFSVNYTLEMQNTGRCLTVDTKSQLNFPSCSLYAQNYAYDGTKVSDSEWPMFSSRFKNHFDTNWELFNEFITSQTTSYMMNMYFGLILGDDGDWTMEEILDALEEFANEVSKH